MVDKKIIRGDTSRWAIPLTNTETNQPQPLHNVMVEVTSKWKVEDTDEEAAYYHYLRVAENGTIADAHGMTIGPGGPEAGIVIQELTPSESRALRKGTLTWDVQVTLFGVLGLDGNPQTYTALNLQTEDVELDVTQRVHLTEGA